MQLQLAREQPTVICVRATKATTRRQPWLRREEFDALASRVLGDMPQYELAELLDTNPSSLSLYRQGKRPVSKEFIAAAMDAFPGVPTQKYVTNRRPEVTR